jgi:hypothetical protein
MIEKPYCKAAVMLLNRTPGRTSCGGLPRDEEAMPACKKLNYSRMMAKKIPIFLSS